LLIEELGLKSYNNIFVGFLNAKDST
jgi:hypothetical protein